MQAFSIQNSRWPQSTFCYYFVSGLGGSGSMVGYAVFLMLGKEML